MICADHHGKATPNPLAGHCYTASEYFYHLLGGSKSNYKPMFIRHENQPHWFLKGKIWDEIVDITATQFRITPPYSQGIGKGFLTNYPSKRAIRLAQYTWKDLMAYAAKQNDEILSQVSANAAKLAMGDNRDLLCFS